MKIHTTSIEGILIIEPEIFKDNRGLFLETYNEKKFKEAGIRSRFVQDNNSYSMGGVIRGLHYQLKNPQGKLIHVKQGAIFDVAVDIRLGSPTFSKWIGFHLSAEDRRQIFIPEGFAHGFYVLSERASVDYKCTAFYAPEDEYGIRWNDPEIAIDWPTKNPILSEKDAHYPLLSNITEGLLPRWEKKEKC